MVNVLSIKASAATKNRIDDRYLTEYYVQAAKDADDGLRMQAFQAVRDPTFPTLQAIEHAHEEATQQLSPGLAMDYGVTRDLS